MVMGAGPCNRGEWEPQSEWNARKMRTCTPAARAEEARRNAWFRKRALSRSLRERSLSSLDAALTVAQADARLEELTALLAEIRSNMRPEFEDRFAQVRAAGQEMIMLSDAWFAMNPNAPPEMSINAVWVSDLERITIAVQQLHRDVLGIGPSPAPPSPLFWGIAAAVVLGVGFVFYKSAYGDLNGLEAAYRHPRFRKAMSRDESESLWSKIDSEISPFSKRYAEFSKKLQKAKDRAESGDCANAYALWEEARLTHEGFSDKKQSGRSLVIAAAAIRRNC